LFATPEPPFTPSSPPLILFYKKMSKCFSLKDSKKCPNFDQFAILESEQFNSVQQLDEFITNTSFQSTRIINIFKQDLQCELFNGNQVRFGDSSLCAFFITLSAEKCTSSYVDPNARLDYCASTCDAHIASLSSILSNTTICKETTDPLVLSTRAALTNVSQSGPTTVTNLCAALRANPASTGPTCFKGIKQDFEQCGFATREETVSFCATGSNSSTESCCKEFAAINTTTPTSGTEVLNPVNNVFIISGIFAGVLAFLGIAFLLFQKLSKSSQRPTTVYRQSTFQSNTQSGMFSLFKETEQPPLPDDQYAGMRNDGKGPTRSSLFTTIRASQVLNPGSASAMPKPFDPSTSNRPFTELIEDHDNDHDGGEYKVQVFEDYDAGMDDEITCTVGDIIIVKERYDDGTISLT
jgi:hypothetical protein